MSGSQAVRSKLARERHKVDELDPLVAAGARHRSPPTRIFIDEAVDDAAPEPAFVIEHVMGDAEPVGDLLRVVDVLPRAAGARAADGLAMVVEL